MASNTTTFPATTGRAFRRILPWALALAVATCTNDQNGPSAGGTGYFSFRPVYGISSSLSQFGIVADSIHITLTRPVDQVVLDTTVFFPPDSTSLRLALPVRLEQSPETLAAVVEIKSGATILFVDSLDVQVLDGPPTPANIPTIVLDYVGPGKNVAAITILPGDTTMTMGDTLFFTSTAVDSSAQPVATFFTAWKTSDTTVARINAQGRLIAPNVRSSVQVIGYTPTGIADTTTLTFAPVPVIITADSGDTQSGQAGDSLGALFVARVKGPDSLGISGIAVRFAAVTAGGAVRDTVTLLTDAQGRVRTRGVLGTSAGAYSYTATVVGTALTRNFTATATAGAAISIAISAGNAQSDSAGRVLATPLAVRVADAFDNPVAGAKVYWTRTLGTGTVTPDSSFTDGSGIASATYTLGAVGLDSIRAALAGTSAFIDFSATAISGAPASVSKSLGDAQSDTVGRLLTDSLVVVVTSATAQPVAGSPVAWTVLRGGSTSTDTVLTDGNGRAAVAYTLGTVPGTDSVRAQAGGASAVFTATVATGAATSLALVSGDAQTDTTDKVLPLPLVVRATDAFGNNVAGTAIAWSRSFGNGTLATDTVLTDGAGLAANTYTLGSVTGTDTVVASLVCGCSTVTFTATAVSAAPASIVTIAGDSQSVVVNTVADTFQVLVRDGSNNPLAGAKVNWAFIPAVGSFTEILPAGIQQSFTDSLGVARGIYTAGTSAGTVRVEAQIGALIDSIYVFAVPAPAAAITIQSGDGQADTVGNAIPLPFVVRVADAFNNPVAGAQVAFTRIAGSGTLFADTLATDSAGLAAVGYLFGLVPGVDSIRVTLVATGDFVDFTATALAATPAGIILVNGEGQSGVVASPVAESLLVHIEDAGGTGIAAAQVIWSVIRGGTLDVDTVLTDSLGYSVAHYTLGTIAGTDSVQVTVPSGGLTAIFTETALAGPAAAISLVSGDGQADTTGRTLTAPLTAFVGDAYGNAVGGAAVTFTTISGSGAPALDTVLSNAAGQASVNYTLGATPGTDTVRAQLVGTSAFLDFTATAVSGAPAFLNKLLGDLQQDTVLSTLTDSLVVQLVDGSATPVPNTWIYWTTAGATLSADSTLTDAAGRAAVRVTLDSFALTVPVLVRNADTTVATGFTLTARHGLPAQLTEIGGNGQADTANATLALPFQVLAQDAYGNLADSARVAFTRFFGVGTVVPDTAVADTLGIASAAYTLGGVAGTDSIVAQLVGAPASVVFTATATAGGAASLVYVSGTGQTDTVARTLASPFTVEVRDAGSNPVSGAWVVWTVLSGGGSLGIDSVQTDGAGVASATLTLGTAAGLDSVIATLGGTADTVAFYALATADAPFALTKVSGDSQSSAVSTTLPAPLVVLAADQYGNPISGLAVDFGVTSGPGGGFANPSTTTDAAGLASSGTVNLAATAGTTIADATSPAIVSDTVYFTIVALPLGTSKQWLGTASTDWGDPNNWAPAGVPTTSDNVFVPVSAPNQPLLDVSRTIGGLQVETGADVNVQGNILTLNGSLIADGTITRSSGHTILAGSTVTARGNLGAIQSTGSVTLDGASTVESNLQVTAGTFNVGGQTLTLNGALDVSGGGAFRMNSAADSVDITGGATFGGSTGTGLLTAGTLVLRGDLSETSGSATFRASGTHRTVFAGAATQIVTFTGPGLGADQFQEVAFANPAGVVLNSGFAVAGIADIATPVNGPGMDIRVGGGIIDEGSPDLNVGFVTLEGSPSVLPDTIPGWVTVTGNVALADHLAILGQVTVSSGSLDPNGHTLTVGNGLNVTGSGALVMQNAIDSVDVSGLTHFDGSTASGLLTDGVLVLRGAFLETSGSATFRASGNHTTVFAGGPGQTLQVVGAGLGLDQFQHLRIDNAAGVSLNSSFAVAGDATVDAGTLTGAWTATVAGNIVDNVGLAWSPSLTVLTGNPTTLPSTFAGSVETQGTMALPHGVTVNGDFLATNGSFSVNGQTLRVDGDLTVSGAAQFRMNLAADSVDVGGATTWNGSTGTGLLTDGHLVLRGNFSETSGSATFRASGTHTTVFAGAGAQSLLFIAPGIGADQFQNVAFANPTSVTLLSGFAAAGTASVTAGVVDGPGQTGILAGDLVDASGVAWQIDTTDLAGTTAALPAAFPRTLKVSGSVTLSNDVAVHGNLLQTNGSLILNGHTLTVDSALAVSGAAQFRMQTAADSLDVGGATIWAGSTGTGLLTSGTAVFRGDFSEVSGSSTYRASGTHRTVFAGSAAQTVSFVSPSLGGDQFQDVTFANPAGVAVTNFAVAGGATVTDGPVAGPGTATLAGTVTDTANGLWRPELTLFTAAPASLPDSFARSVSLTGTVTLFKPLVVGGQLTVAGGVFTPNGFSVRADSGLSVTGSAQFVMGNAADSVEVTGTATWNGSTAAGLLSNGVLVLHGDLSAPSGSPTFQPSGAHKTRFTSGIHTVAFPANSGFTGNRFQVLEVTNPSTVTTATDLYVAGTFQNIAGPTGNLVGSGAERLVTRGLAVSNWNFDGIRVEYHGAAAFQLDNANFVNQDPTLVQLDLRTAGGPVVTLNSASFTTVPTTGRYIAATDTAANGQPVAIAMSHSFPLDGSAFEQQVAGNDGATIDWSTLVFADGPLDILAGGTLAPVRVALLNPAGDTATFFTDNVTLAIGTNPSSGTLGGTTTQAAVGGIAAFGDLTIDNAGFGYTLTASAPGLPVLTSGAFNVTVPLPAGFDAQWTGATSSDWNDPSNWSTASVPDSTTNVYISTVAANPAQVPSGVAYVNRIQIASGATLDLPASILVADSSVEAFGAINGGANVELRGSGDITGTINATVGVHYGPYRVAGRADISGNFAVLDTGLVILDGADTATVGSVFATNQNGRLVMSDANALLDVSGAANFFGASTAADLTLGTIRLAGDLTTGGSFPDAFAPSGLLTVLNGSGVQTVNFAQPDSVNGSHFGRLQVSTAGKAFFLGRYDAMGDLLITTGAALEDSLVAGFEAHGFTTIDAGGTLDVNDFRTRGGIGVAVGATYVVPTTTYYGGGTFPINPAPYDTLVLQLQGQATGDFLVTGDLRLTGTGAGFDLNGHSVTVNGNVDIANGANLTMQNAADVLNVAGSFFTNGDSTTGHLTNGLLQIAGGFHQAADGSGESFRASGSHVTRFTGGAGARQIEFDSPSISATDAGGSHFAILDLPDGIDSLGGRVPAAVSMSVGGSVTFDSTGSGYELASYGPLAILASSDSVHAQTLETWGGLSKAGTGLYGVGLTRLFGGSGTLPALPYIDLHIAYTSYTLGADQAIPGNLTLGIFCSEVCTSQPGELTVGGHTLTVGADLGVMGLGQLTMGAGDSVDVTGTMTWRGAPNNGHLTGGTLVARGLFNEVGTDAFQADAAHRTVMLNPGVDDIYTVSNSWFGKLYLLGGERRIRSSAPLIVLDSLVLGSSTAALTDTLGFSTGQIDARGPILTAASSAIRMDGSMRIDVSAPQIFGSYVVQTTILGGTGQVAPNLTYGTGNIQVIGTVQLATPIDIGNGSFTVDGSAGTADLDLNGQSLQVGDFTVAGNGTLTSTTAGSGLVVRGNATFNGGDETGRLTEGGITFKGFFTQDTLTSQASYYSSGNHTTVFADSSFGGSQAVLATMFAGQSRFNNVAVYGRGVLFFGQAWVGGDLQILDPGVDSVGGGAVTIEGGLVDAAYKWKVDSTLFLSTASELTALPDSIDGNVIFAANHTLADLFRVGGELRIEDTVTVNGYTVLAHGGLVVTGPGLLRMTNPTDDVVVDGQASFEGAVSTGSMTEGRLTLNGDLVTGNVTPGSFDPTGNHVTVLNGAAQQNLTFVGGPQGYGPNQFVTYNASVNLPFGMKVKGTFRDSVEAATLSLSSTSQNLDVGEMEANAIDLTDLTVTMGDQSVFDTATFHFSTVQSGYALSVVGPGRAGPLDLHAINFPDYGQTAILLAVGDTLGNGTGIDVRMFGSTPFNGSSKQLLSGFDPTTATWSQLALNAPLPATVDSAVPFNLTLVVKEPDGSNRADVIGIPAISLAANPTGATLSVGSISAFDGQSANINGLSLDKPGAGVSFLIEMQGRAIDNFTTGTLDVINPAPAGAVVFDGGASDGLWTSALNWSTDAVPAATDSVFIPAGTSVTFTGTDTVGTLVLGSGADLNIASGTLVSTGNVYAGNTIAGFGTLQMAGSGVQLSGTFPTLRITGTATAVGPTTVTGDLIVTGSGADFNVGGQKVSVSNTLFTQNSGVFTMDGAADTLYIASGSFGGGDETGRLTDGVLIIQGSGMDQAFGDPNSFHASGNHTTIFANGGTSTAVNIGDPASSQFANVKVQNPFEVGFNESGLGLVRIVGDLSISAGGVATGDTLDVGGAVTVTAPGDSLDLVRLRVNGALNVAGGYNVPLTELAGTGQTVAGTTGGYQAVSVLGTVALGGPVTARSVTISSGSLDINGRALTVDSLFTNAGVGDLVMDNAADTVIVTTRAQFNGTLPAAPLTAGYLEIQGDLNVSPNWNAFVATAGHITRFAGAPVHQMNFPGEGNSTPLGTVVIDSGAVLINDDVLITGDLVLHDGHLADSSLAVLVDVNGAVTADDGSATELQMGTLSIGGALSFTGNPSLYAASTTRFAGTGQVIPQLPYQGVEVTGDAVLGAPLAVSSASVINSGRLDLNGFALNVTGDFGVNDAGHLIMHTDADTLWVGGLANFAGEAATGDMTAGTVRAKTLFQSIGSSSSQASFQQTGTARVVMLPQDTLAMFSGGPASSFIRTLDVSAATDTAWVGDVWINDSLVSTTASTVIAKYGATNQITVMGMAYLAAGEVWADSVALGGGHFWAGSAYQVPLTKFVGSGQSIAGDLPYQNVEVYYNAQLVTPIDLTGTGGTFVVKNTGNLDMNGQKLTATEFHTEGFAVLTMRDPADTLIANYALFAGDATDTTLTNGTIIAITLEQQTGIAPTTKAFAPSGSNRLVLDNLGTSPDGVTALFQTPGLSGSHANILVAQTYGMLMTGPIVVADSLLIDNFVSGIGNTTIEAYGPAIFGPNTDITIDSLIVRDTLVVDPAATYNVANTVYAPGAPGLVEGVTYQNLILDTSFVLAAPFVDTTATLIIRGTSDLTPNGFALDVGALQVVEEGTLTMQNAADSVVVRGAATFDGNSTSGLLTNGQLLVYGDLDVGNSTTIDAFAPTGGQTVRFSGSHAAHSVSIVNSSNGTSWLRNVVVADTGTLNFNANTTVIGTLAVADSARLTVASAVTLDLYGPVTFGNDVTVQQSSPNVTVNYNAATSAGTNVTYDIDQSNFYSVTDLPDLTYTELAILDGAHVALGHDITAVGNITVAATTLGGASLDLNGHTVSATNFYLGLGGLHGQLLMSHTDDTLHVSGAATFAGDDLSGLLTDGVIRIGGSLTQQSTVSASAFAATGTRTEFFSNATHGVSFDTPGASHFADLALLDGGTLQPTTGITATGGMTVDTSSVFSGALMGSGTAEFMGKVRILDLGQINATTTFNTMFFHDSLVVAPTGSYAGFNSIFQGTDGIPDASYVHMYLRQGVHLTLTHPLFMTGGLNIQNDNITGNPADTVLIRLNGNRIVANSIGITGYGRITMDNAADSLEIGTNATFNGVDQDTSLTAGVLRIGGYLQQVGTYSTRSFAPTGTRTEFYGSGTHNVDFANPGVSLSHLQDLAVVGAGTSVNFISTASVLGNVTVNTGATLTSGSPGANVFFFGKVNALGSGAITNPTVGLFTFNDSLTVATPANYNVVNTAFQATNAVPVLPYTNLYLNEGVHDTLTADLTVNGTLSLSASTVGGQDFVLNGNTVNALTLTTQNEGRLTMANALDSLIVGGTATFGGGDQTGLLTAGLLSVGGNFYQNGLSATGFVADSGHTTQFAGTGTHQVYFSTPSDAGSGGSHFGSLSFATDAGLVLDVQSSTWAEGTLTTTGGSTPTIQNGTIPLQTLTARDVNIDGITFDHVQFHLAKTTGVAAGAGSMNSVTFQNFLTSEDQFLVDLPGEATQYDWGGFTFTQLNPGDTGHYLVATDTDGSSPDVLDISLGTNNWGVNDPPFYVGQNGALLFLFAP